MRSFLAVMGLVAVGCSPHGGATSPDAGTTLVDAGGSPVDAGVPVLVHFTDVVNSKRFVTREHFLAAGEMQISGEPFAEAMGRDLSGYSRDNIPTNIYFDPSPLSAGGGWIDLTGFATAVESYEYSKQPMNNVGLESGAGTSLVFGPLIDIDGGGGADAASRLAARLEHFSVGSNAFGKWVFPAGTYPIRGAGGGSLGNLNASGTGVGEQNPLGWPGIWPTLHPFADFDPTITPTAAFNLSCSISSDDDPGASGAVVCTDYECDYTTLHLPNRTMQVNPTITPGADGFSAWKFGLWCMNYLQVMHDSNENGLTQVDDASQLSQVGSPDNQLLGNNGPGTVCYSPSFDDGGSGNSQDCLPGTFLGSSDIEGFQSQTFIEEIDNRAEDWLTHLTTTDGVTLTGFAPTPLGDGGSSAILTADAYSYSSPLQWFPGVIAVSETTDVDAGFPRPIYKLSSATSDLLDLAGLAMGYSTFFALTDQSNPDVGGAQTALVYFDGDPFPADDQLADGEPTLHDRALGMMRVALVNMDRINTDPTSGLLVDDVAFDGEAPTLGTTVSTTSVAYVLLALRSSLRGCSSQLELYSNNTPDRALGTTALDTLPINYPGNPSLTFAQRMTQIQLAEGELLYNSLTDDTGQAWDGWNVSTSAPIDTQDLLDSHTAAIRGLFSMFFATGDAKYRNRAMAVFNRMESVFYDPTARFFSLTPAPVDSVEYTPVRFALLESALRDVYEVVAARPGGEPMQPVLEEQVGRLIKLVLNGWDDFNQDSIINWPGECTNIASDAIPAGGLQMGERALTGEIGDLIDQPGPGIARIPTTDRENDCVPDIAASQLPSALADSVTFTVTRTVTNP